MNSILAITRRVLVVSLILMAILAIMYWANIWQPKPVTQTFEFVSQWASILWLLALTVKLSLAMVVIFLTAFLISGTITRIIIRRMRRNRQLDRTDLIRARQLSMVVRSMARNRERDRRARSMFWVNVGKFLGNNNQIARCLWIGFWVLFGLFLVQNGLFIVSYLHHPMSASIHIEQDSFEKSVNQYWHQDQDEPVQKPVTRWVPSSGMYTINALLMLGFLLMAVIYWPISRLDELKMFAQRLWDRIDTESGGVLTADKAQAFKRLLEGLGATPKPSVALAGAAAEGGTVAPPVAAEKKQNFFQKYIHYLPMIALVADELKEALTRRAK